MKNQFLRILSYLKVFWWVIVLIIVMICGGWFIYTRRKRGEGSDNIGEDISVVGNVMKKISDATTDVQVNNAVIKTKSEIERKEIEEIRKEPDGKKRREKLAKKLSSL